VTSDRNYIKENLKLLSGLLAKFVENQPPPLDPRHQSWGRGILEKQGIASQKTTRFSLFFRETNLMIFSEKTT
jgi:hypothetical protein